ncbi:MAG: addiction module antidote protein, HigA family [Cytophagales bacterium]|nr:MAG: addiction module antidote protein, HigA family [Cytophagales bacterium]
MMLDQNISEIFLAEPIHPGEMLQDELEARSLSQRELAAQLGVSPAFVNALIHGRKSVSVSLAMKLEKALEINASFWLNAQRNNNRTLAYQKAKQELEHLHVPAARHAELLQAVA